MNKSQFESNLNVLYILTHAHTWRENEQVSDRERGIPFHRLTTNSSTNTHIAHSTQYFIVQCVALFIYLYSRKKSLLQGLGWTWVMHMWYGSERTNKQTDQRTNEWMNESLSARTISIWMFHVIFSMRVHDCYLLNWRYGFYFRQSRSYLCVQACDEICTHTSKYVRAWSQLQMSHQNWYCTMLLLDFVRRKSFDVRCSTVQLKRN